MTCSKWILRVKVGLIEMVWCGYQPLLRLSLLEHDLISVDFNCRLSNRQYGLRMCLSRSESENRSPYKRTLSTDGT